MTPRERELEVRRAELEEAQAAATFEQAVRLQAQGLISVAEFRRVETERERARLGKERALLALANELPAFRVQWARKVAGRLGEIRVRLVLESLDDWDQGGAAARTFLVSIRSGNTIIGEPYQTKVETGPKGSVVPLEFVLLRDTDELTVSFISGSRREDVELVVPRDDSSHGLRLGAPVLAIEGVAGESVEYSIDVERFAASIEAAALAVEGLPAGFETEWIDTDAKARVAELRFPEKLDRKRLGLRIRLPADSGELGDDLPFRVVVRAMGRHGDSSARLDLRLRVVGAPRLALSADNLLVSFRPGEGRELKIRLLNEGNGAAGDVRFDLVPPPGFEARLEPHLVKSIRAKSVVTLSLYLAVAPSAVRGEYTMKLRAASDRDMGAEQAPELLFRIEVGGGGLENLASAGVIIVVIAAAGFGLHRVARGRR